MFYSDRDVDPFEHEIEFDRLCNGLTGKGAETLALKIHASQTMLSGQSKLVHLHAVSELAGRYADKYYNETDFNEQRYRRSCCKYAGLLHEVIEYGGTFEDIVSVSDEMVARMVSSLTPDNRLPWPKRRQMMENYIGRADEATQLVKLADLQHDCYQLLAIPTRLLKLDVIDRIDRWRESSVDLLATMLKIKESIEIIPQLISLKANIQQLIQKCKGKSQRRV